VTFKKYVARRTLETIPGVLAVIVLAFVIIHIIPGDPISKFVGPFETDIQYVNMMRERFGLNEPLHIQLWKYMANLLQGEFGRSVHGRPVLDIIAERIPATLMLTVSGLVFALVVGIFLGVAASRKPYSVLDSFSMSVSIVGYSVPVFWLAQMLVLVFALELGILPAGGMTSVREEYTGLAYISDVAMHLVLPALALGVNQLALIGRLVRSSMLEVFREDYIMTARSKGIKEKVVVYKHALRNALLPVVTATGMQVGYLLTGAVLTETVFSWPGLGRLLYESLNFRDYPVLMGMFVIISISVVLANFFTDIVYSLLDPRVRYG
jgi:peptide/nickel transport system permease protein